MQTSTQAQPDAAPPAPAATPTPQVAITIPGPDGTTQTLTVPQTREQVEELLGQRNELTDQLSNVTARRNQLSNSIVSAPQGASRTGLEARIRLLDDRILQLETDLAVIGRKLSAATPELLGATEQPGENQGGGDDFEQGILAGGFFTLLLFPVALLYARRRWRRGAAKRSGQTAAGSPDRFDRLEQGIEAIAIEVERVSEGQRFVTKLLSESQSPVGLSHRIPQPVAQSQEPVKRQ